MRKTTVRNEYDKCSRGVRLLFARSTITVRHEYDKCSRGVRSIFIKEIKEKKKIKKAVLLHIC